MYHMGGLAPAVRTVIYGTTLVLQHPFDAEQTAAVIDAFDISGVSLVPTQLKRLLDAGLDGRDLETVLLGGAPASESLLARAREASIPVSPTYGLTETASQVATATPAQVASHPNTVGQPLFGTTVQIVDSDGNRLPAGESGEIVVDGSTVTPGYLDDVQTEQATSELGLHTGDVGYLDEENRLWVQGRTDDMIQTGGELVAPAEVAEEICRVQGVDDCAVVGLEDSEWGQRVTALVVPDPDSTGDGSLRGAIADHCRDTLAGFKRPKAIEFADSIPRTHSGTIDREAVRDALSSR